MEADLTLGPAPPVTAPRRGYAVRRQAVRHRRTAITQWRLSRPLDKALEGTVHILPSRFEIREKRHAVCYGNLRHAVALLCRFATPNLTAQGEQRLPP
jgi:hypothetical protein